MGWEVPWYSAKDSADALLAGRWFGMQVCYLRHGDRVFETYWSSGRAAEALAVPHQRAPNRPTVTAGSRALRRPRDRRASPARTGNC